MTSADSMELFYAVLFSRAPAGSLIELRPLKPKNGVTPTGQCAPIWVDSVVDFVEVAQEQDAAGYDVYAGVNPRRQARGKAEDVNAIVTLVCDADVGEGKPFSTQAELHGRIAELPEGLSPSMIVESGGGAHLYWVLQEPLDPKEHDRAKAAMARLRAFFEITERDKCDDLPRILRVPGTHHRKGEPRPVVLREVNDRVFALPDFDKLPEPYRQTPSPTMRGPELKAAVVNLFTAGARQRKNAERKAYSKHALSLLADDTRDYRLQEGERDSTLTCIAGSLARRFLFEDALELAGCFQTVGWDRLDSGGEFPLLDDRGPHESFASKIERFQGSERQKAAERLVADPGDPGPTAKLFLDQHPGLEIVRTGGDFLLYEDTHWITIDEEELSAALRDFLEPAVYPTESGEWSRFKPTGHKIAEVAAALRDKCHERTGVIPRWRGGAPVPANEVLACANGLLHLPTRALLPHTSDFLNSNALPYPFDPDAPEPKRWLRFLEEVFPDDPETIGALQEWCGYVVSGATHLQKIGLFVGPRRSGKGTIARVLEGLLGRESTVGPTLNSLAGNFGLQPLIGKSLAVFSDARLSSKVDQDAITERLLTLSGGDLLNIPRKNREDWSGYPSARMMILSNELPRLGDVSGALPSRFYLIPFTQSFLGREDFDLGKTLAEEAPAVLNWCLEGETRLRARGRLVVPAAAQEAVEEIEALASPVSVFVDECLIVCPGGRARCADVFDAWKTWCQEQGREHPGTVATLGRNLRSVVPGLRIIRPRVGNARERVFENIELDETILRRNSPMSQLSRTKVAR